MAKQNRPIPAPQGEMTILLFQMRGDDPTLQKGIGAIQDAISRMMPGASHLAIPAPHIVPAAGLPAPASEEPVNGEILDAAPVAESSSNGRQPKKPVKSPEVLEDLDLTTGDLPLKAFLAKFPASTKDRQRYLRITYWLKHTRNITDVSADHIHTAYRHMGWQTPADAGSPLRTLCTSDWFTKSDKAGFYRINHIGENKVMGKMEDAKE